ncbi:MAG: hypothetical protein AB7G75_04310 [Candidatus Binatia bacterium]
MSDNNLHALKQLILDKTQGSPFFMEEIVQELVEQGVLVRDGVGARPSTSSGAVPLPTDLHIPPTVQAVLAARIDRLAPEEKALLQQLSVIGRQFPMSLVRQVIPQSEADLYRLLASLQHKEFLYEQPAFPESEYIFKHALTQEVAYGTVLQEQRKLLHERTGQVLETVYAATLSEHYNDLAHHYRRSPNTEKAIHYLQRAGQQAVQRSAHTEAISQITAALELLKNLPETADRSRQELTLQITLGAPLIATTSWTAPEVEKVYTRALALCQQAGETSQLFPTLWGLWAFYLIRAEYKKAYELGKQLLSLAQSGQDATFLLEAHYSLGVTLTYLGEGALARAHLEQGNALYNPQLHHALAATYGSFDPGVNGLSLLSLTSWLLGYPDQALERSCQAMALTQALAHPFSSALTLGFAAWFRQFRRERQDVQERSEAAVILSSERGFPFPLAWGTMLRGWAAVRHKQREQGIAQIREGLTIYQATGSELARPYFLALLAEAHGIMGQVNEGLVANAEALRLVDKTDERFYEAELYRLKGALTLESKVEGHKSKVEEAEECFLKAIAIAQKQQAKSLELRAVMSLVRLQQQQAVEDESRTTHHAPRAKLDEAHRMLSEVYNWFTEGFDTKDLQEAKALLEELR